MKSQVTPSSVDRLSTLSELCQVIGVLNELEQLSPEVAYNFVEHYAQYPGENGSEFVGDSVDQRAGTDVEWLADIILDRGQPVN